MSLMANKNLFYPEYCVRALELKGDYEIWAADIKEYFHVSGYPNYFKCIDEYTEPDPNYDIPEGDEKQPEDKRIDKEARHKTLLQQSRYAIYRSLGDSIKKELAKERFAIDKVVDLCH